MQQRASLISCCPVLEGDWGKENGSPEASSTKLNKLKLKTSVFKKSSRYVFVFSNPSVVLYDSTYAPQGKKYLSLLTSIDLFQTSLRRFDVAYCIHYNILRCLCLFNIKWKYVMSRTSLYGTIFGDLWVWTGFVHTAVIIQRIENRKMITFDIFFLGNQTVLF